MMDAVKELKCCWENCGMLINLEVERRALAQHVTQHLPDVKIVTDNGEEMYLCSWGSCAFTCKIAREIIMHVKYHAYHSRLKTVGASFAKRKGLPNCTFRKPEEEQIPVMEEVYSCKWSQCEETFTCLESFILHSKVNHVFSASHNSEKRYICLWDNCETDKNQLNRLFEHMRGHTGEKILACPTCGQTFVSVTKFSNHCYRQLPVEENRFKCRHCLNRYPTVKILQDHMRLHIHRYKCNFCDLTCRSPAILAKHIRYRHLSSRPFKCPACPHRSKTQYDSRVHQSTHIGEMFLCDAEDCDFTATTEFILGRHADKVHGSKELQTYRCHLCEKKFSRGYGLTKHLSSAHNVVKPDGFSRFSYRCDEDGYWRLQTTRLESVQVTEEDDRTSDSIEIQVIDEESGQVIKSNTVNTKENPDTGDATLIASA